MPTPLFSAIEAHDPVRLRTLLESGADPNEVDVDVPHTRPLHAAIVELEYGAPLRLIEILLESGADINATYPGLGGGTPLLVAMFNEQWDAAKLLLDLGADPNVRGGEGDAPLRWCAKTGNLQFAQRLLAKGAGQTIDGYGGWDGMTALGLAAQNLDASMVEMLLEAGARPDALDLDHRTARQRVPAYDPERRDAWLKVTALLAGREKPE